MGEKHRHEVRRDFYRREVGWEAVLLGYRLERLILYSSAFLGVRRRAGAQSDVHDPLLA
jgi:hypothetical protein